MKQHQAVDAFRNKKLRQQQQAVNSAQSHNQIRKSDVDDPKFSHDDDPAPTVKEDVEEEVPKMKKKKAAKKVLDSDANVIKFKKKKKSKDMDESKDKKSDEPKEAETEDEIDELRKQYKKPVDELTKKRKKFTDDDDDDKELDAKKEAEELKEKTIIEKQKDIETQKAASQGKTSIDVIKADDEVVELKKELKENKEDL